MMLSHSAHSCHASSRTGGFGDVNWNSSHSAPNHAVHGRKVGVSQAAAPRAVISSPYWWRRVRARRRLAVTTGTRARRAVRIRSSIGNLLIGGETNLRRPVAHSVSLLPDF